MSHFYSQVTSRGTIHTKCGDKSTGMSVHVRGWYVGVRIDLDHINGQDIITINKTGGSSYGRPIGTNKTIEFKERRSR